MDLTARVNSAVGVNVDASFALSASGNARFDVACASSRCTMTHTAAGNYKATPPTFSVTPVGTGPLDVAVGVRAAIALTGASSLDSKSGRISVVGALWCRDLKVRATAFV